MGEEKYLVDEGEKAKLLIKYGFLSKEGQIVFAGLDTPSQREKKINTMDIKDLTKYSDQEYDEERLDQWIFTEYPKPNKRYRLDYERYDLSLEESYFWILNYLKIDNGYAYFHKVTDVFTAAEHSDFWGVSSQRIGLQQDKVSQFLATIGKMIRELFQLVRELRIFDERLSYYRDCTSGSKSAKSAEITLKGLYIDMAEGGSKNPASVFGMARELQFVTLPDLFFDAPAGLKVDELDQYVDHLAFNETVKRVLRRKLRSFIEWRNATQKEMVSRRIFTLKFLRQHFDIIRMYTDWIKPYLKNIRRLTMHQKKTDTAELVSAFEGSMVEIEFVATRKPLNNKKYSSVVLANFDCRTHPTMSFHQEGYAQRGPIHTGRIVITLRAYMWTDEQIQNYIKMKDEESIKLISDMDTSLKSAMEALGDELMKYLKEAGETNMPGVPQIKKEQKPQQGILDPFVSVFRGIGELGKTFIPSKGPKRPKKKSSKERITDEKEKKKAQKEVRLGMWNCYKNYKKAHEMLAW